MSDILTAVTFQIAVLWDLTKSYQCCLQLQDRRASLVIRHTSAEKSATYFTHSVANKHTLRQSDKA
jgi:hypothetical protein